MADDEKRQTSTIDSLRTTPITEHSLMSSTPGSSKPIALGVSASFTGPPADPLATIGYEVKMFFGVLDILRHDADRLDSRILWNAGVENAVLHARQLCQAFLNEGNDETDILLEGLIPDWESCDQLKDAVCRLKEAYGKKKDPASARYAFNKGVMHATNVRGEWGEYGPHLKRLEPIIRKIIGHIESRKGRFRDLE